MSPVGRHQDVPTIEREIQETRLRLSRDLAMLDREYAVRSMVIHALRFAGQGKNVPSLAASAKYGALPLGLIGLGFVWLVFADPDRAMGRRLRDAIEQTRRLLDTALGGTSTSAAESAVDGPEKEENA